MTAFKISSLLESAIDTEDEDQFKDFVKGVASARSFKSHGVRAGDAGFVLTLWDGTEFEVTFVKSN